MGVTTTDGGDQGLIALRGARLMSRRSIADLHSWSRKLACPTNYPFNVQRIALMTNPIVPWMGGKRRLSKRLLALFPDYE